MKRSTGWSQNGRQEPWLNFLSGLHVAHATPTEHANPSCPNLEETTRRERRGQPINGKAVFIGKLGTTEECTHKGTDKEQRGTRLHPGSDDTHSGVSRNLDGSRDS